MNQANHRKDIEICNECFQETECLVVTHMEYSYCSSTEVDYCLCQSCIEEVMSGDCSE
jgi:hypothetical protein